MALNERLELLITANGTAAVREFGKVGNAADKELKKTQGSLDKTASTMTSVGTKAIGVGVILTAAFVGAAKAADESEIATAKMLNTIENAPSLAGESVDQFEDLATALQKTTVATDEQVLSAEAMLGQFGLNAAQIKGLTPLVVDLSRKMGIDMESAAKMVGKAMDGSSGALKKAGIVIDENTLKTDAYAAVTEGLSRTVGGFAEQEGKTFNGQLTIMKNNLGEISEGVGRGAISAFNDMLGPVKSLSGWFQELDPAVQGTVGQVGAFVGIGVIAAGVTSTLIGQAIKMRDNFKAAADGAKSMWGALRANPAAVAGIAAAAGAVYLLTQRLQDNQKQADKYVKSQLDGSDSDADRIEKLKELKEELEAQQGPSQDLFGAHLYLTEAGRKHADQLDAVNRELETLEGAAEAATGKTGDQAVAAMKAADATQAQADAIRDLNDAEKALLDPQFAMLDATQRLSDAQNHYMEVSAYGTIQNAETQQALIDVASASADLDAATRNLTGAYEDGSVSIDETRRTLDLWVAQGKITKKQADDLAWSLTVTKQEADKLSNTDFKVRINTDEAMQKLQALLNKSGQLTAALESRGIDRTGGDSRDQSTGPARNSFAPAAAMSGVNVFVGGEQVAAVVTSSQRYDARGRR